MVAIEAAAGDGEEAVEEGRGARAGDGTVGEGEGSEARATPWPQRYARARACTRACSLSGVHCRRRRCVQGGRREMPCGAPIPTQPVCVLGVISVRCAIVRCAYVDRWARRSPSFFMSRAPLSVPWRPQGGDMMNALRLLQERWAGHPGLPSDERVVMMATSDVVRVRRASLIAGGRCYIHTRTYFHFFTAFVSNTLHAVDIPCGVAVRLRRPARGGTQRRHRTALAPAALRMIAVFYVMRIIMMRSLCPVVASS